MAARARLASRRRHRPSRRRRLRSERRARRARGRRGTLLTHGAATRPPGVGVRPVKQRTPAANPARATLPVYVGPGEISPVRRFRSITVERGELTGLTSRHHRGGLAVGENAGVLPGTCPGRSPASRAPQPARRWRSERRPAPSVREPFIRRKLSDQECPSGDRVSRCTSPAWETVAMSCASARRRIRIPLSPVTAIVSPSPANAPGHGRAWLNLAHRCPAGLPGRQTLSRLACPVPVATTPPSADMRGARR